MFIGLFTDRILIGAGRDPNFETHFCNCEKFFWPFGLAYPPETLELGWYTSYESNHAKFHDPDGHRIVNKN